MQLQDEQILLVDMEIGAAEGEAVGMALHDPRQAGRAAADHVEPRRAEMRDMARAEAADAEMRVVGEDRPPGRAARGPIVQALLPASARSGAAARTAGRASANGSPPRRSTPRSASDTAAASSPSGTRSSQAGRSGAITASSSSSPIAGEAGAADLVLDAAEAAAAGQHHVRASPTAAA